MSTLSADTTLQNGKYRIISTLGQGGFGITYLAENTMLKGKVAIKEFFYKEYCGRDADTRHVTVPTSGNREIVERFKQKFIKEARTIFSLNHPNIVRIHDVFEENDTAYYVMEYIEGESLSDMVKRRGSIPEAEALAYVRDAAQALNYIHSKNINHLDVKPGNLIKRRDDGKVVLIDFGVAKQYDAATSEGTTTTPVCISAGYSPMEQYLKKGVQSFSPQSDVYALAATLYKLLTGVTPPEAMAVQDEGLPVDALLNKKVSEPVCLAIAQAMKGRKERTQSISLFLNSLAATDDEPTEPKPAPNPKPTPNPKPAPKPKPKPAPIHIVKKSLKYWLMGGGVAVIVAVIALAIGAKGCGNSSEPPLPAPLPDSIAEDSSRHTSDGMPFTVEGVTFEMVRVEGGTFTMGATPEQGSDANDDEKPAHQVTLSSYYIGKTEVTQALWQAVMGSNPSQFIGADLPVENVSWEDCQEFIRKLNALTGNNFRLPTEAEWEFAARGGNNSRGYKYSGSNTLSNVAWYLKNSGSTTHPVATKSPNELGIYDMSGNVFEWCSDWDGDYSSSSQYNPTGPNSGACRVHRGASCSFDAWYCRVSHRNCNTPASRCDDVGLRLAL